MVAATVVLQEKPEVQKDSHAAEETENSARDAEAPVPLLADAAGAAVGVRQTKPPGGSVAAAKALPAPRAEEEKSAGDAGALALHPADAAEVQLQVGSGETRGSDTKLPPPSATGGSPSKEESVSEDPADAAGGAVEMPNKNKELLGGREDGGAGSSDGGRGAPSSPSSRKRPRPDDEDTAHSSARRGDDDAGTMERSRRGLPSQKTKTAGIRRTRNAPKAANCSGKFQRPATRALTTSLRAAAGVQGACPAPPRGGGRAPSPPMCFSHTILARDIHTMAMMMDLRSAQSMKGFSIFLVPKGGTFRKPPLHILGGYRNWSGLLHGIRYFNELLPSDRTLEFEKMNGVAKTQRKILRANMEYLMANRPSATTKYVTKEEVDRTDAQLQRLVCLAAERSAITIKRQCNVCGFLPTSKIMAAVASMGHVDPLNCTNCTNGKRQQAKKISKDKRLAALYTEQIQRQRSCMDASQTVSVDLVNFAVTELGGHDIVAELVEMLGKRSTLLVEVKHITINYASHAQFKRAEREIAGAEWCIDGELRHHNVTQLSSDEISDAVFMYLPRRKGDSGAMQNFAVILNNDISKSSCHYFAQKEMISIDSGETGHRPGPASGVFNLGDKCHSFSRVTQKPTTAYLASGKKSVHMRAVYENAEGRVKKANHGYVAMQMARIRTGKKLGYARSDVAYQEILVCEALSYIAAIAILKRLDIPSCYTYGEYFVVLKEMIEESNTLPLKDILWKWMCTTGEIRNHQACKCHTDGNSSHPYEIMTLFNRPGTQKSYGFLYLPLDNMCIKLKCGSQSLVSNFTETPHAADLSRNYANFSKVHGPPP